MMRKGETPTEERMIAWARLGDNFALPKVMFRIIKS